MMSLGNMVRGLENNAPARELIQYWDHDVETLMFWRASSNFVYLFELNGKRHYLRFIHEEDNSTENIQAELDFMLYLLDKGYATVAPVRSKNGLWIETIATTAGCYYGVVFEQVSGVHLPLDQMSDHHFEEWGSSLASLHELSEAYNPGKIVRRQSWYDVLDFVSSVLERYPLEHGAQQELEQLRSLLSELPSGKGHTGLIHYDFETDNVFYVAAESRYCVIDFDDAMVHWFMMDITSALSDLIEQDDEIAKEKLQRFLKGYRSVKLLDDSYVNLLPVFQRFADLYTFARLLRSIEGMDISRSPDWAIGLKDKLLGVCDRIRSSYQLIVYEN